MLERYIVKTMKRWHSKLNYITLSPKHPTPAQKRFHFTERARSWKHRNRMNIYQCSYDKSSRRINRRMYNKLTPRQSNIDNPYPRLCRWQASLRQQLKKESDPTSTRCTWEIHSNLGRTPKIRRRSTRNGQEFLVSNRMGIRLKRHTVHQRIDPPS